MSKKGIKSKGFRVQKKAQPYITKKELYIVIAIVVVLVLGVVLFNCFYNDGSLKVVNKVAQVEGENSLIVNTGKSNAPIYFKLGQAHEIDGFTLSSTPYTSTDANVAVYCYNAEDTDAGIDNGNIVAMSGKASVRAESLCASLSSSSDIECGELQTMTTEDEHNVYYVVSTVSAEAPTTETEETSESTDATAAYVRQVFAFEEIGDNNIYFELYDNASSVDALMSEDAIVDSLKTFIDSVTYENV